MFGPKQTKNKVKDEQTDWQTMWHYHFLSCLLQSNIESETEHGSHYEIPWVPELEIQYETESGTECETDAQI